MRHFLGLAVLCVLLAVGVESKGLKYPPPLFEGKEVFESPNLRAESNEEHIEYRLPNATVPDHYNVQITTRVHLKDKKFTGVVKINITVLEDTKNVVLHARKMVVDKAVILDGDTTIDCNVDYNSDRDINPTEFLVITPKNGVTLTKGKKLVVQVNYNSELRTDGGGFYLSTYKTSAGEERWLATTQFESTDARHAFPCYDEPAKRATFQFTLIHGNNYNAISNTVPIGKPQAVPSNGLVNTTFITTTPMSTYLTAFIVSDFEFTEGEFRGLKQRVYSRPETKAHQEFALTSAMQLIAALDDYFGVKFQDMLPDAKLYQVAVPDFNAGAMENWGLTTYREEYLLYEQGKSTAQTETNIVNILGHENVHQWFGDYVAIKWWTYLWLKESFAEYYSYVSNDIVYPLWDIYQLYIVSEYQRGMNADSGAVSRPMTHYVQTPKDISNLYDSISYAKGSAILRMWNHALTENVFRGGLTKHLQQKSFSSAVEEELFENIQKSAQAQNFEIPLTIDEMMGSWTRQSGHPLLIVERNYADGSFTVRQQQFFDDSTITRKGNLYVIPFNYASGHSSNFTQTVATHYFKNESTTVDAKLAKDEYLILNKQSTGFYKIQYDVENWKLISKALRKRHFKIHVLNRAELLFDANKLSSSSRLDYDILLDLLAYLEAEEDYAPWATASGILTSFDFYLQGNKDAYSDLKFFIQAITNRIYDKLGASDIPNERHFDRYLRSTIISLACLGGNDNCLSETSQILTDFVEHNVPVQSNLKSPVFCNGLKDAERDTFDKVHQYMLNSDDLAERRLLIASLGCAQRKENVDTFIKSSIDKQFNYRNNEESNILFSTYSKSEVGLIASIEFLSESYDKYYQLNELFGGKKPLESDLENMPRYIATKEVKQKYDDLLAKIKSDASITLSPDLEANANTRAESNIKWNTEHSPKVAKWLFNYARSGAGQMFASAFTIISALFVSKYLI